MYYLIAFAIFMALAFGASACSASLANEDKSRTLIENTTDLRDIRYEGKAWFMVALRGCSEEDTVIFRYSGAKSDGRRVTVETCQGWPFKGATLRG